jgi:hypothetical protein
MRSSIRDLQFGQLSSLEAQLTWKTFPQSHSADARSGSDAADEDLLGVRSQDLRLLALMDWSDVGVIQTCHSLPQDLQK